jgi:hypothetical protein
MSTNNQSSGPYRRRGLLSLMFFALTAWQPGSAVAAGDEGAWRPAPQFDVRAVTRYRYEDGESTSYPTLGAHLGFDLSPPVRPWATGLFADYELATGAGPRHIRLAGGWARYRFGRWELATAAAHFTSDETNGLWMYSGKLQFTPRPGHKLAVEAIGAIAGGGDPALQLAYESDLTRRVSLSINVGLGANRLQDFGASSKISWKLR